MSGSVTSKGLPTPITIKQNETLPNGISANYEAWASFPVVAYDPFGSSYFLGSPCPRRGVSVQHAVLSVAGPRKAYGVDQGVRRHIQHPECQPEVGNQQLGDNRHVAVVRYHGGFNNWLGPWNDDHTVRRSLLREGNPKIAGSSQTSRIRSHSGSSILRMLRKHNAKTSQHVIRHHQAPNDDYIQSITRLHTDIAALPDLWPAPGRMAPAIPVRPT